MNDTGTLGKKELLSVLPLSFEKSETLSHLKTFIVAAWLTEFEEREGLSEQLFIKRQHFNTSLQCILQTVKIIRWGMNPNLPMKTMEKVIPKGDSANQV